MISEIELLEKFVKQLNTIYTTMLSRNNYIQNASCCNGVVQNDVSPSIDSTI